MLKHKGKYQTYTDGWGTVWKVKDRRLVGIRQAVLHFQEQTVGERRYWDAFVAGTQIIRAVRVPYEAQIEQGDVLVINGKQYEVVQKDLRDDRLPASWILSLASVVIEYRGGDKDSRPSTNTTGKAGGNCDGSSEGDKEFDGSGT